MGNNMAPIHAKTSMANLEEERIYVSHHFVHVAKWFRYIDDVFVIWISTHTELNAFFEFLNSIDSDIKFTMDSSDPYSTSV